MKRFTADNASAWLSFSEASIVKYVYWYFFINQLNTKKEIATELGQFYVQESDVSWVDYSSYYPKKVYAMRAKKPIGAGGAIKNSEM